MHEIPFTVISNNIRILEIIPIFTLLFDWKPIHPSALKFCESIISIVPLVYTFFNMYVTCFLEGYAWIILVETVCLLCLHTFLWNE